MTQADKVAGSIDTSWAEDSSPDALRIFISYSRIDLEIADALVAALERNGFIVTIDRRDLPYGEEWQAELQGFIATADSVIWLVSPASVKSKWCNWELGEVTRLSKRLVPVRVGPVEPEEMPQSLGRIHMLPVVGLYEAARNEADLVKTLNTDRAWLKKATSLGERARDWAAGGRDRARMLRGAALTDAEAWSVRPPRDVPAPSSEILELILASRRAQRQRQRFTVAGSLFAAIIAAGLGWYGLDRAAEATRSAAKLAEQLKQAQINESRYLAEKSNAALLRGDLESAAAFALQGLPADPASSEPDRPMVDESIVALEEAIRKDTLMAVLQPHSTIVLPIANHMRAPSIFFNASGGALLGRSGLREVTIWEVSTGRILKRFAFVEDVKAMASDRSNENWIIASGKSIFLIDTEKLEVTGDFDLESEPLTIAQSPNGSIIAAAFDDRAEIWDAAKKERLHVLSVHTGKVTSVQFSQDGTLLATGSDDTTARVWSVDTGVSLFTLNHATSVYRVAISQSAGVIATGTTDGLWTLFQLDTGLAQTSFSGYLPADPFGVVAGNNIVATLSKKNANFRLTSSGRLGALVGLFLKMYYTGDIQVIQDVANVALEPVIRDFPTHNDWAIASDFSDDGKWFAVGDFGGDVRLWDLSVDSRFIPLYGHKRPASTLAFSPDSKVVASTSWDGTIRIWQVNPDNEEENSNPASSDQVSSLIVYARAASTTPDTKVQPSSLVVDANLTPTKCDSLASQFHDPDSAFSGVRQVSTEAIAACEAVLALQPKQPRISYLLGRALMSENRYAEALAQFKIAADGGYRMALESLAYAHYEGQGVKADPVIARSLFQEAFSRGVYTSGRPLGAMYWSGEAGPVDRRKALEVWEDAAARGDPFSHESLAWVAELGRDGSELDLPKALYHYSVAVKLFEQAGNIDRAVAPRYRRGSLARSLGQEIAAQKWREAMAFKGPTSYVVERQQ